jgi:hypothetical protein
MVSRKLICKTLSRLVYFGFRVCAVVLCVFVRSAALQQPSCVCVLLGVTGGRGPCCMSLVRDYSLGTVSCWPVYTRMLLALLSKMTRYIHLLKFMNLYLFKLSLPPSPAIFEPCNNPTIRLLDDASAEKLRCSVARGNPFFKLTYTSFEPHPHSFASEGPGMNGIPR